MVDVLITNIREAAQVQAVTRKLKACFPSLKIDFDLQDNSKPFPCGHTILRVEGAIPDLAGIQAVLHEAGFACAEFEDKVCKQGL